VSWLNPPLFYVKHLFFCFCPFLFQRKCHKAKSEKLAFPALKTQKINAILTLLFNYLRQFFRFRLTAGLFLFVKKKRRMIFFADFFPGNCRIRLYL